MSIDETMNGNNATGVNNSIEEIVIKSFDIYDLRFPTSLDQSGSDAMNPAGDYSSSYVILHTSKQELDGHGFAFTIGRGNDLVCAATRYTAERLVGKSLAEMTKDMGKTWRYLVGDSQLRWLGPEKGVVHLGLSACVNALWDLWARYLGKPVWQVVGEMTPDEFVRCIDFRYILDAITPDEAINMLKNMDGTKIDRIRDAKNNRAVAAYSTQAGWLGFSDEKMIGKMRSMLEEGFDKFKLKVGGSLENDIRRLKIARDVIGYDKMLMIDANQVWSVSEAIEYMLKLVPFKPVFIEEPTSPDDVLGHAAIRAALKPFGVGVATGEHCQNRVVFKQLLQSGAIDVCQIDACRLGGVNEVLSVLLMAKKFNVPVVPHSGGIGLNEYTQHLALVNYISLGGERALLEHINSFSEVITHPVKEAGYSVEYKSDAIRKYEYPRGEFWNSSHGLTIRNGLKH
ncbi:enolase C-terminal domain-like protein [Hyaloscypha bicolor E]|uniref:Enolase C-terminal domain-like protein n=1 Tax=Hyaloscypha bicolor E TaxID=1095630 RepID=A0A2J6TGK4_9HELO|nr:enolase C-terminal domain-like protein [Hyaloscypha bicolor E]PMD62134.1 enolase C-terminal domain-like protein [Hyaloscypha bicolor E]